MRIIHIVKPAHGLHVNHLKYVMNAEYGLIVGTFGIHQSGRILKIIAIEVPREIHQTAIVGIQEGIVFVGEIAP